MKKAKAKFVMFGGPSNNRYIAPSGADYRVIRGTPFLVTGDDDIAYFLKKKSCFKKVTLASKVVDAITGKDKDKEADKDTSESGFEKGSAPDDKNGGNKKMTDEEEKKPEDQETSEDEKKEDTSKEETKEETKEEVAA